MECKDIAAEVCPAKKLILKEHFLTVLFILFQERALIEQQELRRAQKEQAEKERLRLENEKRKEREEEEALERARYVYHASHPKFCQEFSSNNFRFFYYHDVFISSIFIIPFIGYNHQMIIINYGMIVYGGEKALTLKN